MKIWLKISFAFSIIAISIAILGYFMMYELNIVSQPFKEQIPNTVKQIQKTSILNGYAQSMKYYDEVLTQSARNYAFTQDKKWEERYHTADPALSLIIDDAIKMADAKDLTFFSKVNDSNIALLKMEYASLALVDQGHQDQAIKILESKEYWDQKNIYQQGLRDYVARHGADYEKALEVHTTELNQITTSTLDLIKNETNMVYIGIIAGTVVSVIMGFVIVRGISKPISNLRIVTNKIANGDFNTRINVTGNDEISDLSNDVNIMAEKLCEYNTNLIKKERLSAIGEMAARLGHDLRNPLSVIISTIGMLKLKFKNGISEENIEEKYDRIERSIIRMSHQIEDVLDFVRVKPLELGDHSLADIVKEASDRVTKSDNIKINLPQNDLKITCDSKKLEIVVINIMTNAIQAMGDRGEIAIRITDDVDSAHISIEDSGPGIEDAILPKIFDPLFTTKQTGTGLGLVSCKNIVEQHGGSITIKNNPTTFTIIIPKIRNGFVYENQKNTVPLLQI